MSGRIDKTSEEFQLGLWAKWPMEEMWPGVLDLYEAAAYKRVNYQTLYKACQTGKDGRSKLAHQRFGTGYRIKRATLDAFGYVPERSVA